MNNNIPDLVSVIITTKNRLNYLIDAIESVKSQTYENFECIVVDDASDYDVAKSLHDVIDERFKIIQISKAESKGGNYARNVGIAAASGNYISLLDDDDMWKRDKIEKQVHFLENNQLCNIVYCPRIFLINNQLEKYENINIENQGDCSKRILYNIIGVTSTIMYRMPLNGELKFDEDLKFWQEYDVMIGLAQNNNIGVVNEPLVIYRINYDDKKRLTNKFDEWLIAVEYIENKYKSLLQELNEHEINLHKKMIYYDAASRCSGKESKRKRREYLKKIYLLDKTTKNLCKYLLNIDFTSINKLKLRFTKQSNKK